MTAAQIDALFPDEDRLREECGVFGVFGAEDAAVLTALGLHALQHRGQEGCGIATWDGARFHTERHLGLVGDHFSSRTGSVADRLPGPAAIGHTRYATQGGTILRNVQPFFADLPVGGFAIAHNGNITNARLLREDLSARGSLFTTTSDTEVVLHLMACSRRRTVIDRFIDSVQQIDGAFALVCLAEGVLIGARDRLGIRPLVLGDLNGAPILASETCALDMVGARFVRAIENGEVVVISQDADKSIRIESHRAFPSRPERPCVFEFVYFARPDSIVNGRSVYSVRKLMGAKLASEQPAIADIVVPVPDSGVPAALGFAEASGMRYDLGIIRNHYVGRTFIQPSQGVRQFGVRMKHSANREVLRGKRVVLIDDSIVRGTTSRKIVKLVREAGAAEVHFRSASPMIRWPDFYGIDMPNKSELLAAQVTPQEMAEQLDADSVGFLSVDGLYWALGEKNRNGKAPQYADHCFTGDYPTDLEDFEAQRAAKDLQLSLLAEAG